MKEPKEDTQVLQGLFLNVVHEQLKKNDPPETAQTLKRLISKGIPERDAMNMLAICIAHEVYAALESDAPFNRERFVKALDELPGDFL
ncbi:MAG: hypothetical protein SH848_04365 [Saprospiraceae bacterium]|nr:hypothetical protein [Saprospiraceae bacterium]MDZ4703136.1 hypothetical protein [Saprospiraceae bacterium]